MNNTVTITVDPKHIISLESAKKDRIYLPYDYGDCSEPDQDELIWQSSVKTMNSGYNITAIQDIKAFLQIRANESYLKTNFSIDIYLRNGERLTHKALSNTDNQTITNILDNFFRAGATGLNNDFITYFETQYQRYKAKYNINAQEINT